MKVIGLMLSGWIILWIAQVIVIHVNSGAEKYDHEIGKPIASLTCYVVIFITLVVFWFRWALS